MRTAIATVCLSGTLPEKLEAIAAARFKGVEIFENDLLSFDGTPTDVRRMVGDLGLEIVTFQPFRDFEGLPEPQRQKAFSRAERKFDTMEELGCDLLLVCSNVSPAALPEPGRAAVDFHDLGERAAKRGLRVGFEALAWGRHVNDYRQAWDVVQRAAHPAIGLVLDSFHQLVRASDPGPMRAIPADRIFLVQLADAPRLEMDYLSWSRHYRCFPGQGDLPVDGFMDALAATGFDGLLSLEIFNDRFRGGSARSVAIDGQRSLTFLLDELARRAPAAAPTLPPRARCTGVAFAEFAMDETSTALFEPVLEGLGFRRAGQHRTKAVTRWSQGDINLVVNNEREGFAHSYNVTHGASVCALALRVDDAGAAVDRATLLLDKPYRQAVGPGELDIPAVRGVGGSLLYFVDGGPLGRNWDVDFMLVPRTGGDGGAGLVAFDHLSQSMQYEEMLSWLLFYTSLLDLSKSPSQAVLDPGGVVQSQVVQDREGALRIVLNASQSRQTLSSRFLDDLFGSGVQHIAFATADIFSTAARLKANGVPLLPIPANYYDDLEARLDIADDELARLRTHGVLYDRDGDAEFFQLYTATLENGLFFEIVQRRDYAGFGAANAPIRLAAQTRLAPMKALPSASARNPG